MQKGRWVLQGGDYRLTRRDIDLRGHFQGGAGDLGRESSAFFSNSCDHLTHFSEAAEGRVHSVYNKYALGKIFISFGISKE